MAPTRKIWRFSVFTPHTVKRGLVVDDAIRARYPLHMIHADWQAIRESAIAGVPWPKLESKFGVNAHTIRKRSLREDWPIPSRIKAIHHKVRLSQDVSKGGKASRSPVLELAKASISEVGQANALLCATETSKLLARAFASGMLPVPDSWLDAKTAFGMVEKATGRDRPLTSIGINIGGQMWADIDPGDICEPL